MPATFVVRSIEANDGIRKIHLSRDQVQPNEIWINATGEVLADIFGADVREGDMREVTVRLIARAGSNGTERRPIAEVDPSGGENPNFDWGGDP